MACNEASAASRRGRATQAPRPRRPMRAREPPRPWPAAITCSVL